MAGGRVYGGSNLNVVLQGEGLPCSSDALDALLVSCSSPSFHGARSMVNFEEINANSTEEDFDECFHQPEKKRRLSPDQVQFLEKNFEVENKLEPERKIQLARELGLQPRQVAIWFQNRRARWKTKQLEKDYGVLKSSYDALKADYENLLKEKEKLKTEVVLLTDKLLSKERDCQVPATNWPEKLELKCQTTPKTETVKDSDLLLNCKQEDLSSNSSVFDAESPTEAGNSPEFFAGNSPEIFEPDNYSDSSLGEEESGKVCKERFKSPQAFVLPKLEEPTYPDQASGTCNYGFHVDDQEPLWFWPY
ncbi:hypothetical protein AMTRI_Chr05g65480 [Amborella trichopoda]|uniref:Homeobox-leucine zipper protein n=1 Tax=Amborella trichopoda TaxID=13333 RepID=W1P1R9_AMBTC|nr:homeobox-leucine zipper protein HAT5 [Amborella trichopoda]ERN03777.1 hypothetical protein AMTR_s00078p00085160 [Amborella trichopoda]|eukprot:XP_006842102.1 homeobox-leucine zipper protein HAT5 [Amborella trichopoda]